jgi:hypothetical protein
LYGVTLVTWRRNRPRVADDPRHGTTEVHVEFHDYTLHVGESVFYAVGRERGRFVTPNGALDLRIRTARIFRRVDGRWRQVHHHGSIDDPALLERYQRAVRA